MYIKDIQLAISRCCDESVLVVDGDDSQDIKREYVVSNGYQTNWDQMGIIFTWGSMWDQTGINLTTVV